MSHLSYRHSRFGKRGLLILAAAVLSLSGLIPNHGFGQSATTKFILAACSNVQTTSVTPAVSPGCGNPTPTPVPTATPTPTATPSPTATPTPTPTPATGQVNVQGTLRTTDAATAAAINTGDFSTVTASQLAAIGVTPGMSPKYNGQAIASVSQSSDPNGATSDPNAGTDVYDATNNPDSASGCHGDVCIWLYGKGLFVRHWDTNYDYTGTRGHQTYAVYWLNGQIIGTGVNMAAATSSVIFWEYWGFQQNLPAGKACNTWFGDGSRPCETIHP